MDKIFNYPVVRNDEVAWQTKNDESITMVKSMMKKNTPLVTRGILKYMEHWQTRQFMAQKLRKKPVE